MAIDSRNSTDSPLRSPEVCQKVPVLNGETDSRSGVEIIAALLAGARASERRASSDFANGAIALEDTR
jgi:hypothetical protein